MLRSKDIVLFEGKECEVRSVLPGLVVLKLPDGKVVGADPQAVQEKPKAEPKPKTEQKPKAKKKAE